MVRREIRKEYLLVGTKRIFHEGEKKSHLKISG